MVLFFIFIILVIPFIYPLISNLLIHFGFIQNINEIKEYLGIFGIYNILLIALILFGIKHYFEISFSEILEKFTTNIDFSLKRGDSEVQVHMPIKSDTKKTENMAKETREEAYEEIIREKKENGTKCEECDLINVKEERESLRFFSAYQITNQFARELLKKIIISGKIESEVFINEMNGYYKSTIKNMGKVRKNQYIEKKINELLYNLRYLDLIEYSEDDNYILLTQKGIEFVKGYEEGVG